MKVRYWGFVPSTCLSPHGGFVTVFPSSRSCLPPFSVILPHAPLVTFVVAIFLFRLFLFAPLRCAFFKVEKRKRPLFFQRWLFLHSLRGIGTASPDFYILPRYFATRSPGMALYVASLCWLLSVVVPPPSFPPPGFIPFAAPPLRELIRSVVVPPPSLSRSLAWD